MEKGHSEIPGINYSGTFMAARDKAILRIALTLALHLGHELFQIDIGTAYLYGNLKETTSIIQPEGFGYG